MVEGADTYRYVGPEVLGLDVFIWPIPESTTEPVPLLLQQMAADFESTMPTGVERGWYDAFSIAFSDSRSVAVKSDTIPGHQVGVVLRQQGRIRLSFFFIFGLRGQFVKVRLTIPEAGWQKNEAVLFPDQLIEVLASGGSL